MRDEAAALLDGPAAFRSTDTHTVYQEECSPLFKPDHPRNRQMESAKRIVDFARVGPSSPLKELRVIHFLSLFVFSFDCHLQDVNCSFVLCQ